MSTLHSSERWRLEDEARFLRASLADAEAEHQAGDLSDEDFSLLRRRDATRLAVVEEALGQVAKAEAGNRLRQRRPRRRRRQVLGLAGAACLAAGVVVLVVAMASPRLPGQASSGSLTLSKAQQVARDVAEAEHLENAGQLRQALVLYQAALALDPHQPEALAESGWLQYEAGVAAKDSRLEARGASFIAAAAAAAPHAYLPRLYEALEDVDAGQDAEAVAQFQAFLVDHPPTSLARSALPLLRPAYAAEGRPPPSVP